MGKRTPFNFTKIPSIHDGSSTSILSKKFLKSVRNAHAKSVTSEAKKRQQQLQQESAHSASMQQHEEKKGAFG